MTIKNFQIEYDAINRRNIFTNGDTINGRIILEASKETRIQSLVFIAKGKARVHFTEHYGILGKTNPERTEDYRHKQKYYRLKQYILKETRQNGIVWEMIGKGRHVFPFSFKIPDRTFPSSFSSVFGQIIHTLKAKVKQSMMPTRKAKTHFTFVSIAEMNLPGITKTYNGGDYIKVDKHDILQEKADALKSMSGTKTVTKVFTIPRELPPSILVCPIIKLEYRLKVYLDITYAPYIVLKLPIVILPDLSDENLLPPSSSYICELLGTSYEPPRITRLQAIDPPPPYEAAASYPLCSSSDYTTML
uniref:Arrestin domain-containing protein 3-like n=1 Tax=Poecilia latipinna TaxID=48699 RepID=A0A3B3USZ3_9TELE